MSSPHILILLTIALSAATMASASASEITKTPSPLGKSNFLNKGSKDEKIKYITFVDPSRVSKGNEVALINQLHPIATRLASMRGYVLPDHIVQMLNMIFEAITSVLFGPHTDVYWPLFTNVLLMFMRLLM